MSDREHLRERDHLKKQFREGAKKFAHLRPGYPREAVEFLVGASDSKVADVGAGTGKLTRVLVELGHRVVAIEPSPDMIRELMREQPKVRALLGSGERTGLPDQCVDAVTFGQAWHWINAERGSAEAARILKPGGTLGIIYNSMDISEEWVAKFNKMMHTMDRFRVRDAGSQADKVHSVGGQFDLDDIYRERFTVSMSVEQLAELVTTRSYFLALCKADQQAMIERAQAWVIDRFGNDDGSRVELPYLTEAFRFTKLDSRE